MQYRHFGKLGLKPSLLGFGVMRLPISKGKIDAAQAIQMIRQAIDQGVNYVDTAWPYHSGESETITGLALADGYREKVMLATKNPTWLIHKPEDWQHYLDKQLEKLRTPKVDFYLQHAFDASGWKKFKKLNLWDKAMEAKKAGKIQYFGFSFHDDYTLFEEIINAYDWDFCQIQFNYLDIDYQAGLKGLQLAASKNIGVIVMEPLRGGRLANGIPHDLLHRMERYPVKKSPVEWALRYIANQPGVSTVLSGMSNMEQVEDNIRICSLPDMLPNQMKPEDISFIEGLASEWHTRKQVGCTACQYCMPCPHGVDIPGCFSLYNRMYSTQMDAADNAKKDYQKLTKLKKDAQVCAECGACEVACPQQIAIIDTLKQLHQEFLR